MSPHISQALDLLAEKTRQHQARLNRARRTYIRTLVLDEPADPQLLADAVETLGLAHADFLQDAQSGQLHRDSLAAIPNLEAQIRDRRTHFPPPDPSDRSDPNDLSETPDDSEDSDDPQLRQLEQQLELARRHLVEAPRRSPRLFSPEAQELLEAPPEPTPQPQPMPTPSATTPTQLPIPTPIPPAPLTNVHAY